MALINILAKSEESINWNDFLEEYSNLNTFNIEVFPIPKELGFDCDGIGINVHKGYANKSLVVSEIQRLIAFFYSEPYNFKFTELYDGIEVSPETVGIIINRLLPA